MNVAQIETEDGAHIVISVAGHETAMTIGLGKKTLAILLNRKEVSDLTDGLKRIDSIIRASHPNA